VYQAAFSPDGWRILTASDDKPARLWDVATPALIVEGMRDSSRAFKLLSFTGSDLALMRRTDLLAKIASGFSLSDGIWENRYLPELIYACLAIAVGL
jgi:WD40 repeat protein